MAKWRSQQRESLDFEYLLEKFTGDPSPVNASVVALFAELFDDEEMQLRYRNALDAYSGPLPLWLAALREVDVHKAVRISHVLGDFDQLLLGARLGDGREATCAIMIDHLDDFEITDAILVISTIEDALGEFSDPGARSVRRDDLGPQKRGVDASHRGVADGGQSRVPIDTFAVQGDSQLLNLRLQRRDLVGCL